MLGNDQIDTLAKRLLRRIAEQCGRGAVPAYDRPGAVCINDGVSDLIENQVSQFETIVHGASLWKLELAASLANAGLKGPAATPQAVLM
jgi:hypothetical protein